MLGRAIQSHPNIRQMEQEFQEALASGNIPRPDASPVPDVSASSSSCTIVPTTNIFVPFVGQGFKIGGDDAEAVEVEEEDGVESKEEEDGVESEEEEEEEEPQTLVLCKKNQHSVDVVSIKMKNVTYIYYFAKSSTFQKICDTISKKFGVSAGCIGTSGSYDFNLCHQGSILTSYETIGVLWRGRMKLSRSTPWCPECLAEARAVVAPILQSSGE